MRFPISRSWLSALAVVLLVPSGVRKAHSAEVVLPKIQTSCITYPQAYQKIYLSSLEPSLGHPIPGKQEEEQIRQTMGGLLEQKRWDEAKLEIKKISYPLFRNEMGLELVESLGKVQEIDLALRMVSDLFEKQPDQRARGIGIIAVQLVSNQQFPQALEALKRLPPDPSSTAIAVTFVVDAIAQNQQGRTFGGLLTLEQMEQIRQIVALFPNSNYQEKIWHSIGKEVELAPQIATQIIKLIQNQTLRTTTLDRFAQHWIDQYRIVPPSMVQHIWGIANDMKGCVARTSAFLDLAGRIASFDRQYSRSERIRMLDQIEALINAINPNQIGDRRIISKLRIDLADLNQSVDRQSRSLKLLERVTNDRKGFQFHADRAEFLLAIAQRYRIYKKPVLAVRTVDLALTEVQEAYSRNESALEEGAKSWREEKLYTILYEYEVLKQPAKAAAIRQMLKNQ